MLVILFLSIKACIFALLYGKFTVLDSIYRGECVHLLPNYIFLKLLNKDIILKSKVRIITIKAYMKLIITFLGPKWFASLSHDVC